jgi:hypothetical protein
VEDDKNFSVDITQIRLQRKWNGRVDTWGWKQLGWKGDRDWMWTSEHSCSTHRNALWRAVAWYRWTPNADGGVSYDVMGTGWFGSPCQT